MDNAKKFILLATGIVVVATGGALTGIYMNTSQKNGDVLALQAGQVTAQLAASTTTPAVNQAATIELRLSAAEAFRMRGAQFSILVPKTLTVSNVQERISLGSNNAFPALAQHLMNTTGQSSPISPFEIVSFDTLYNELRITLLTLHQSVSGMNQTISTGTSAIPLVSFTVTPLSAGSHTMSFRSGFPHMVADETINYLNTSTLSSLTLQTGGTTTITGTGSCAKKTQGDVDCSGQINATDLNVLIQQFGTTNQSSDIDSSGEVNIFDLSILLKNFGH